MNKWERQKRLLSSRRGNDRKECCWKVLGCLMDAVCSCNLLITCCSLQLGSSFREHEAIQCGWHWWGCNDWRSLPSFKGSCWLHSLISSRFLHLSRMWAGDHRKTSSGVVWAVQVVWEWHLLLCRAELHVHPSWHRISEPLKKISCTAWISNSPFRVCCISFRSRAAEAL